METDSPLVKPDIVFIEDLLGEIAQGMLRVPRFQRPFVWKPKDMLNLFDSIYKGYPIGSLLFWESSVSVENLGYVGPIDIPDPGILPLTYILDGHQRLATLFGALCLPQNASSGTRQRDWQWWVWFDLKNKEFVHVTRNKPAPWLFPIRAVQRTVDFLAQARRIMSECPNEGSDFIEEAEQLAQKIKNYKVAITRIKGGSLEQAVTIFSRLNTLGVSMTPDQMVSALTYREDGKSIHLAERIDQILERLSEYHFGNIKRLTVLHAIVAASGKNIHRSEWENIAERLMPKLAEAADQAEISLFHAAWFLREFLHVPGDRLLPYTYQILMLSEFFRLCLYWDDDQKTYQLNWNEDQKNTLIKWFWCTSLSGWFAGQNTANINNGINEMRRLARGEISTLEFMPMNAPARPFPDRFYLLSARVRSFILFMLSLNPLDPAIGSPLDKAHIFHENGNQAMTYIFPRIKRELKASPANRILLERVPEKPVKDQILSVKPEFKSEVLASHGIPYDAFNALSQNNAEKFIDIRAQYLAQVERDFISNLGIPPAEEIIGETDIDTDGP